MGAGALVKARVAGMVKRPDVTAGNLLQAAVAPSSILMMAMFAARVSIGFLTLLAVTQAA